MGARTAQPIDPAQPLHNPRWEAFCRALVQGVSQADAYREAYPHARRWKADALHVAASELAGKVRVRVAHLQHTAEAACILDRDTLLRKLRDIIEEPATQDTAVRAIAQASRILGLDKSEVKVSGSLPELLASLPPPRQ